jgi:hypothetical protein
MKLLYMYEQWVHNDFKIYCFFMMVKIISVEYIIFLHVDCRPEPVG